MLLCEFYLSLHHRHLFLHISYMHYAIFIDCRNVDAERKVSVEKRQQKKKKRKQKRKLVTI